MTIDKLFKRFLKETKVYGSDEAKACMGFMTEYNELFYPFNAFRWDTSKQGHIFWFEMALNWLTFLYNNFGNIDNEDVTKGLLREKLIYLMYAYAPIGTVVNTLGCYEEVMRIRDSVD